MFRFGFLPIRATLALLLVSLTAAPAVFAEEAAKSKYPAYADVIKDAKTTSGLIKLHEK